MDEFPLSHYLTPGRKLAKVVAPPDENGCATYQLGEREYEAKDITVINECGQIGMVPWARVELNKGEVLLVNLANVESVELLRETDHE